MLVAGFISTILGTTLPGPGTIYLHQGLGFSTPVRFGDTITARVEVKELDNETNRVTVETICFNQDGVQVLGGWAGVSPPQAPRK
ncbi:MAG: hypothetical protein KJ621_05945 [Proteobacteria bacterium]|nr:hypothetical protein [Pseudomonadota bacterium]MBU1741521.1 hypothetical protein [Pseudomonadota bacterium]